MKAIESAEFDDALETFSRVAVEDPTNPIAWFYLGLCYLETGRGDLAGEALDRAIAADPDYADAHYLRGTVMGSAGQIDLAAESYKKALAINPRHYKAEEFLIRTEALIESRKHYREAVRLIYSPQRDDDWYNRAVRNLLDSTAIFTDSPARNEFKGIVKFALESGARTAVRDQPDIEGSLWEPAIRQAERAVDNGQWHEAVAKYQEALDLSPDRPFIHHALGLCYFSLDDITTGMRAWQRVLDLDSGYDFRRLARLSE
ncbi:MAG TPA: tetratricopeptide repeat protein [Blastocatellia bacterium]